MPIKGKTDGQARWPVIGKLRKGGEREGDKMGRELPYFRFTPTSKNPDMARELMAAFEKAYGKQPAKLDVVLPYAGVDEVFPTWMEEWGKTGLEHRCDGEIMEIWLDGKSYSRMPKPCPYASGEKQRTTKNPGCKQIGRLFLALPELVKAGYSGVVVLETHSDNDLRHIDGVLKAIKGPRGLMGVPCVLWREQMEISVPSYKEGDNGRMTARKWMVRIAPYAEYMAKQVAAMSRLALADNGPVALLSDGRSVDTLTGEVMEPSGEAWGEEDYEDGEIVQGMAEEVGATSTRVLDNAAWVPQNAAAQEHADAVNAELAGKTGNGNGKKVELRYMPDGSAACPVCSGPMWDNRAKKASGENKPNAPDFKCKNRECDGKYWTNQWHPKEGGDGKPVNTAALLTSLSERMKKLPATWGSFGEAVKAAYNVKNAAGLTEPQIAEINCKLDVLEKLVDTDVVWHVKHHPVELPIEVLNEVMVTTLEPELATEGEGA